MHRQRWSRSRGLRGFAGPARHRLLVRKEFCSRGHVSGSRLSVCHWVAAVTIVACGWRTAFLLVLQGVPLGGILFGAASRIMRLTGVATTSTAPLRCGGVWLPAPLSEDWGE